MRRSLIRASLFALLAASASADGGELLARRTVGELEVSVFAAPSPLAAGPIETSVLVQERASGRPLLDADVRLSFTLAEPAGDAAREADPLACGPDGSPLPVPASWSARATLAGNRLFHEAVVELRRPGRWSLAVEVEHAGRRAHIDTELRVGPPPPRTASFWPQLAFPPLAIALYALNRVLRRRRALLRDPVEGCAAQRARS